MLVAGAMVALSMFFVFRLHHPSNGLQPPHLPSAALGIREPTRPMKQWWLLCYQAARVICIT
jgi:hypothetical protein